MNKYTFIKFTTPAQYAAQFVALLGMYIGIVAAICIFA